MKILKAMLLIICFMLLTSMNLFAGESKKSSKHAIFLHDDEIACTGAAFETLSTIIVHEYYETHSPLIIETYYDEKNLDELARIMYWEADNQDEAGKLAVANVVLNRKVHDVFPDTVSGVISQRGQFTPTQNKKYYKIKIPYEYYEVAKRALDGENAVCCENVVYFSRGKARYMKSPYRLGDHWFGHIGCCLKKD